MGRAKPDCTGQRFGRLLVLGKGSRRFLERRNCYQQLWRLQCDCGNIIELCRGDFDETNPNNRRQKSCGCLYKSGYDNNRRPVNIAGQKFGSLVALRLTGKKSTNGKPTWLFQCDCGNTREMPLGDAKSTLKNGYRLNCTDSSKHPDRHFRYPLTPTPYPEEAGKLVAKYLRLTELPYMQVDTAVEDEKRDRLLRAAWILTYRRNRGEIISELHEKRFISKHLRYCSIKVFWRRKLEEHGGLMYDVSDNKRQIGNTMTNITSHDYPVIQTQGIKMLPTKRFKFKRR